MGKKRYIIPNILVAAMSAGNAILTASAVDCISDAPDMDEEDTQSTRPLGVNIWDDEED